MFVIILITQKKFIFSLYELFHLKNLKIHQQYEDKTSPKNPT